MHEIVSNIALGVGSVFALFVVLYIIGELWFRFELFWEGVFVVGVTVLAVVGFIGLVLFGMYELGAGVIWILS